MRLTGDIFFTMFRGWDKVTWWTDPTTERLSVRLDLNRDRIVDVADLGKTIQSLSQQRYTPPRSGVRFNGRMVGRRAMR